MQGLADGSLMESQADTSGTGPSHEENRALALRQAAALLRDEERVDAAAALQCLPWLIAASPELALGLLEVTPAPPPMQPCFLGPLHVPFCSKLPHSPMNIWIA